MKDLFPELARHLSSLGAAKGEWRTLRLEESAPPALAAWYRAFETEVAGRRRPFLLVAHEGLQPADAVAHAKKLARPLGSPPAFVFPSLDREFARRLLDARVSFVVPRRLVNLPPRFVLLPEDGYFRNAAEEADSEPSLSDPGRAGSRTPRPRADPAERPPQVDPAGGKPACRLGDGPGIVVIARPADAPSRQGAARTSRRRTHGVGPSFEHQRRTAPLRRDVPRELGGGGGRRAALRRRGRPGMEVRPPSSVARRLLDARVSFVVPRRLVNLPPRFVLLPEDGYSRPRSNRSRTRSSSSEERHATFNSPGRGPSAACFDFRPDGTSRQPFSRRIGLGIPAVLANRASGSGRNAASTRGVDRSRRPGRLSP